MSEMNNHTLNEYAQNSADNKDSRESFVLADDLDLKEASKQVAADFEKSLQKTAREV